MSDQGEKMCPLCTEEMDLTDQQLKPCQCGYEMCVWCWHHIIEMAEKDETEARCPACRTPYDKERIVGTAANCGRLAAGVSMEKKRSQKSKVKTSEVRKQLSSSARVIQRNLVYIVGLPLNLADEDLLLRKEYFGQYGKVLKVSMSRTSGGAIQQFANNTCSVYITYSKEEEAVRCIQSIHGFTLEGRSLKACFGTTKYCHAWLRNGACTNSDCLYLHEIGSQEDSFTKDEIISAYSRVQQITGIANNVHRQSGNVLPPPVDDYCYNSSVTTSNPVVKSTPNNLANGARLSPPTSSAGRNCALPMAASWGTRSSNGQSSAGSLVLSNGPAKQKPDAAGAPLAFSAAVAGMTQPSSTQSSDLGKNSMLNDDSQPKELENKPRPPENLKQLAKDIQTNMADNSHSPLVSPAVPVATGREVREPSSSVTLENNKSMCSTEELSNTSGTEKVRSFTDEKNHKLCLDAAPTSFDEHLTSQKSEAERLSGLSLDCLLVPRDEGLQHFGDAKLQEQIASAVVSRDVTSTDGPSTLRSDMQSSSIINLSSEKENDFDIHGVSDSIFPQTSLPMSAHSFDLLKYLRTSVQHNDAARVINHNSNSVLNKQEEEYSAALISHPPFMPIGSVKDEMQRASGISSSSVLPNELPGDQMLTAANGAVNVDLNPATDVMESNIISDILSLDMDAWNNSLKSPHFIVKYLGENEGPQASLSLPSSWKGQSSNQSKFSFARQEESQSYLYAGEPSSNIERGCLHSSSPAIGTNREEYVDRLGNVFGIPHCNGEHSNGFGMPHCNVDQFNVIRTQFVDQYNGFGSSQSVFPTNKHSAVSRAQMSAPPGFSVPSRSPPPGFSLHGRSDHAFDTKSGNYFPETTVKDPYLTSPSAGSSSGMDIEFIDPAILAVGKGRPSSSVSNLNIDMRPSLSSHFSAFESDDVRLQRLLMQNSFQPNQNPRYADIRDNYPPHDVHVYSSRHLESSQNGSLSSFQQFGLQPRSAMSNGIWDKRPEVMSGNNMGMAGLIRNEQLGYNKLYGGYEDSKFQMPNSAGLYNRSFGM